MKALDKIFTKLILATGAVIAAILVVYHVFFVEDALYAVCETVLCVSAWYYQSDIHISDDNEN